MAISHPEQVILQLGDTQSLDVGMLCYAKRDSARATASRNTGRWVDVTSFMPERRTLVRRFIELLGDEIEFGARRAITLRARAHVFLNLFMSWADGSGYLKATDSHQAAQEAFRAYVAYLREQVMQSRLTVISAARFQYAAADMLASVVGTSQVELMRGLNLLRHDDSVSRPTEAPEESEQSRVLAVCMALFEGLTKLVLEAKPYPYRLRVPSYLGYPGDGLWVFPAPRWCQPPKNQPEQDSAAKPGWAYCYDEGRLATPDEIRHRYSQVYTARVTIQLAQSLLDAANTNARHHARLERAAAAQQAFFVLFMANTGFNLQQLIQLEWDGKYKSTAEQQGFRTLKWRAGGKAVSCEVQSKFLHVFRRFLVLRDYMLDGRPCPYLFFSLGIHANGPPRQYQSNCPLHVKNLLSRIDPKLPYISPRRWRAGLSDWAIRHYDPAVAAKLLQNSERTILKRYAEGSNATQMAEMGAYFNEVSRVVLKRAQPLPTAVTRATGLCTDYGHPKAAGVSEAPIEPDCRKPEGCLFCEKYRIHADEIDVRKLLSCLYCMRAMSRHTTSHEQYERIFGRVFARIEELLQAVRKRETGLVERIAKEVDEGELDPYWTNKLAMLQELELV